MIERLSPRVLFAVFGPDLSFDDGFPAAADGAFLRQPVSGGKTLAAFRVQLPYQGGFDEQPEYEIRLTRFLPDGTRDRTFGRNGRLVVGTGYQDVKLVPGQRILVAPDTIFPQAAVQSYTLNGRVDTGFGGGDGVAETPGLTKADGTVARGEPALVAVLDDGRMIFQSAVNLGGTGRRRDNTVYLSRLNADGSFDKTFGKKGFAVFKPGEANVTTFVRPSGLYVRYDNAYNTDPLTGGLRRLDLDGKALDTSFGTNGRLVLPDILGPFVEQPDGKLLYFDASYGQNPVLYRVNRDGSPDATFSGDGKITLTYKDSQGDRDYAANGIGLVVDNQNRLVVSANGTIYRLSPGGTLDAYPFNGTAPFPTSVRSVDASGNVYGADGKVYRLGPPQQLDAKGVVQIVTDAGDDTIRVSDAGNGRVRVNVNGESKLFRAGDVKGLELRLFDGKIDVEVGVDVKVKLVAGNGGGRITTAGGDDDLRVGNGSISVDLGNGNDKAEIGENLKPVKTDRHTVTGSGGNKTVQVVSGSADVTLPAGDHTIEALGDTQTMRVAIAGGNNKLYLSGELNLATVGGSGKNDVTAFGDRDSIVTGDGPDAVLAISSQGTFRTGGGDDEVTVRNFSQEPETGSTVYAGAGDDHVFCDNTYNSLATVYGGSGDDRLEGNTLGQRLYGENGNDTLYGDSGRDTLFGGNGDDLIRGGDGNDRLYGDGGYDRLYGQEGVNLLYGGDDADRFYSRNGSRDSLYGGDGDDIAQADTDDVLDSVRRA